MITGIAPKRKSKGSPDDRQTLQESIVSTAAAVVKAMTSTDHSSTSHLTQSPKIHQTLKDSSLGVSPGKATDIRGESLCQLATVKRLYEDNVLTHEEFEEQKSAHWTEETVNIIKHTVYSVQTTTTYP